jgi:hypothetical protein
VHAIARIIADEATLGTFNATWFLAALVAIGAEVVKLEDISGSAAMRS